MTKGIMPFPPYLPYAYRENDALPVEELSHFLGEHKAAVMKPLSERLACY